MKLVFLDRDGVINEFPGFGNYVVAMDQFHFIEGSKKAIALLHKNGFEINVISNQGCLSRGLITPNLLSQITSRMLEEVKSDGGEIAGVFYCPHQTSDACDCRKPKTGLFLKALNDRKIDMKSVYFIGDSDEDMQAGQRIGCKTILVLSGRNRETDIPTLQAKPDFVKKNLLEAAEWLIQKS